MDEPRLLPAFSHEDARGRLMEVAECRSDGYVNVKMSFSRAGTVRGLHFQVAPFAQAKILRVCSGSLVDVALNLTTGDLYEVRLARADAASLYIPSGYAHGFRAEVDDTAVVYMSTERFDAASERAFNPLLSTHPTFRWSGKAEDLILSAKDRAAPEFEFAPSARHFRSVDGVWTVQTSS